MADLIFVRILLNCNESESLFRGYEPGDALVEVYQGTHRLPYQFYADVSLEHIFASNQWVDESHRPWYDDARSLSKGDVVVLHDKAYAIDTVGFREIDPVEAGIEELII